jgi:hypothetical protein
LLQEPSTKFSAVGFEVFEMYPEQKILHLSEVSEILKREDAAILQKIFEKIDRLTGKCVNQ